MFKITKTTKAIRNEKGQILLLVLVLLLLGSVIITPLLTFMGTGLKTGETFEKKTAELYAADAGIEDGVWHIKYDKLKDRFPDYGEYAFDVDDIYPYSFADDGRDVNGIIPEVTITNIWIPTNITTPSETSAQDKVDAQKLIVTGSTSGIEDLGDDTYRLTYQIKIQYYKETADPDLEITSVGVWLPGGFTYDAGSSNLEADEDNTYFPESLEYNDWCGGQSIVWNLPAGTLFAGSTTLPLDPFPGVDETDVPMISNITFTCVSAQTSSNAVAWITTEGVGGIEYAWDADQKIYKIHSVAGDTVVDTYVAKNDLRELSLAKEGDYYATGNTLMEDSNNDSYGIRDTWVHTDTTIPTNSSSNDVPEESSSGAGDGVAADGEVDAAYLYWTSWFEEASTSTLFSDNCSDFATPEMDWIQGGTGGGSQTAVPTADDSTDTRGTWNTSPYWSSVDETTANDTDYITGVSTSGYYPSSAYRLFTTSFSIPTGSTIANLTIYIRAKKASSSYYSCDIRPCIKVNSSRYYPSTGNSPSSSGFTDYYYQLTTNPATGTAWTVDQINGTASTNNLQRIGVYSNDLDPDVQVSMVYACVTLASSSRWSYASGQFVGQGSSSASDEEMTLTMGESIDLSSCSSGTATLSWDQDEYQTGYYEQLESDDCLYYALSADGGDNWSTNYEAFHDDNPDDFSLTIPDEYLTEEFMLRFYFNFDSTNEYVYIDNIIIDQTEIDPDTQVYFKIDGYQVYFDTDGNPQRDLVNTLASQQITADTSETVTSISGYSYACKKDVTDLVREFCAEGDSENHPGIATYTVGGVDGTLGGSSHQMAHAGWSIVIRYTSPTTKGHYMYMYDSFTTALDYDDIDFDEDSPYPDSNGGTISGFIVPEKDASETIAARITTFVGEGDNFIEGDFIAFNAPETYWDPSSPQPNNIPDSYKLWDGISTSNNTSTNPNNVWNGMSEVFNADGVDIDTFEVPWSSNLLSPGDTSAHLDIYTEQDNWNLIYIIVSIRSIPTTGGALAYIIRTN